MAAMGPAGTAAGSTAGSSALLSPAGSVPNSSSSTAPAGMGGGLMGSAGPSPAASPLCVPQAQQAAYHHHQQQQQQQQQSDIARVTDRLSSLSLPNMSAPSPQHTLSSIGSEHSNDLAVAAAAAAAAQHYSDLKANSAASLSNSGACVCVDRRDKAMEAAGMEAAGSLSHTHTCVCVGERVCGFRLAGCCVLTGWLVCRFCPTLMICG